MPHILFRISLTLENVPQMCIALCTENFRPYTIGIFTVSIIPPNPGPDQDYQVQVMVEPPKEGIAIEIDISGTDDFAYSDTATTGENGVVVFGPIPGGAAGVVETVVVTAPDMGEQETFVFEF